MNTTTTKKSKTYRRRHEGRSRFWGGVGLDGKVHEDEPLLLGGEESHLKPEDGGGVRVLLVLAALIVHKVKVKHLPVVLKGRIRSVIIRP
jgi:hypothetical protein